MNLRNLFLICVWGMACCGRALGQDATPPSIVPTDPAIVRAAAVAWLQTKTTDPAVLAQAAALWDASSPQPGEATLLRLCQTLALGDAMIARLVEQCAAPRAGHTLEPQPWLAAAELNPLVSNNLRLLYGRWLVHERLYDEAHAQLIDLNVADVVDPATLLFFQGVVYHRMLAKEPGLAVLDMLLNDVAAVPTRYEAVAKILRSDLSELKDDSLDHIARRMEDIQRRLELGRAGEREIEIEDGVIASLDKLIKELEDQQQQQGGGSGSGSAQNPSSPMQDSRIARLRGSGETDQRDLGDDAGWGDLPPKEREEALQQIGQDFPAHYREAIEQYFRRLAAGTEPAGGPGGP